MSGVLNLQPHVTADGNYWAAEAYVQMPNNSQNPGKTALAGGRTWRIPGRHGFFAAQLAKGNPQRLMRHESIQTTMRYYVDLDADAVADEPWKAHDPCEKMNLAAKHPERVNRLQAVVEPRRGQ